MPSDRYPEPSGSRAATFRTPQVRPCWTRSIALLKSATWSDHVVQRNYSLNAHRRGHGIVEELPLEQVILCGEDLVDHRPHLGHSTPHLAEVNAVDTY